MVSQFTIWNRSDLRNDSENFNRRYNSTMWKQTAWKPSKTLAETGAIISGIMSVSHIALNAQAYDITTALKTNAVL